MDTISTEKLTAALAELVRDRLVAGEEIHIAGLGTFRVHHQISRIEEQEDGSTLMKPPRDVIAFSADS